MNWLRLSDETPNDPKLRVVAAEAGQPLAIVLAAWVSMLCHVNSQPGDERGSLARWWDDVVAVQLGIPAAVVADIRCAMGGLLLEEGRVLTDALSHPASRPDLATGAWKAMRLRVLERDGHACTYCGAVDSPLQADHVIPVSRGDETALDSLTAACGPCNASKGAKLLSEWVRA